MGKPARSRAPAPNRTMTIGIHADGAREMYMAGDFNGWQPAELGRNGDGRFELGFDMATMTVGPMGEARFMGYFYIVAAENWGIGSAVTPDFYRPYSNEGVMEMGIQARNRMSAQNRMITISIHAEDAGKMYMAGDFNGWQPTELRRKGDDLFELDIELEGGDVGRFVLAGQWQKIRYKTQAEELAQRRSEA